MTESPYNASLAQKRLSQRMARHMPGADQARAAMALLNVVGPLLQDAQFSIIRRPDVSALIASNDYVLRKSNVADMGLRVAYDSGGWLAQWLYGQQAVSEKGSLPLIYEPGDSPRFTGPSGEDASVYLIDWIVDAFEAAQQHGARSEVPFPKVEQVQRVRVVST